MAKEKAILVDGNCEGKYTSFLKIFGEAEMLQLENVSFKVLLGAGEKEIIRDVSLKLPADRLVASSSL